MKPAKSIILPATGTLLVTLAAQAGASTWDGSEGNGLWSDANNWDSAPVASDTVLIGNGDTVTYDLGDNFLSNVDLTLSGNSTFANGGVFRASGSTFTVESGSTLGSGGFWDLDDGTFNFKDGAAVNMGHWEQKDINVFNFELSASGFTTMNAGTFRIGNGGITGDIANATYNVDLSNYTGGTGVIVLVDFSSDAASMDNATFTNIATGADLNVLNAGSYVANIQWNDTTEAIELNITAVPEPGSLALISLGGLLIARRRR